MNFNIYEPDPAKRVALGKLRERQIANALRDQANLDIRDATESQDKYRKIDRWIYPNKNFNGSNPIPLQIKFRTKGNDLLFEVYDTFLDWNLPDNAFGKPGTFNKIGRDMQGDAKMYAVLLANKDWQGKNVIVMVNTDIAKQFIWNMVDIAQNKGWTREGYTKTLRLPIAPYFDNSKATLIGNPVAELKLQHDPGDGRPKMIAYIPDALFLASHYSVSLPDEWGKAA